MYTLAKTGDHNDYYQKYIDLVKDDVITALEQQANTFSSLVSSLEERDLDYRYAPGKWSFRESCIHLIDTEQIFAYRALCISRGEKQNLPGFDQDAYIAESNFDHITKSDLLREFASERKATISMFKTFSKKQIERIGKANDHALRVNSIPYIIAGHTAHHFALFTEKYLS